ncbi:ComF family protein [Pedobacter sp. HMF7056]|uniref:ComF family protein n=2 Tax=Hufsiella ginkgonis TaxID=2695274 RepID=A0A7K1Y259_9SPHI|nr:phosphoribosyltransferase family protein [Hufsiella ginkgonis]MXV17363.1 ComF family protein [Hufsiella ginkgonis]
MACRQPLYGGEAIICTDCVFHLPYTGFHHDPGNRMARQLWGRITFNAAAACLYFRKGARVQSLVHQLKYRRQPHIGNKIGELYGVSLCESESFKQAGLVVPVPLHPLKLRKRGYNQSAHFAEGLSHSMGIPVLCDNLVRVADRETQTRKSRFMRYENMKDVFMIRDPSLFAGKHILLADDVLTTGATIEACCLELMKVPGVTVSIVTIAFAD